MKKTVKKQDELKAFVARMLKVSKSRAKEIIDTRNVFVNDMRVWMAAHTLYTGDVVELKDGIEKEKSAAKIKVLYENPDMLAVDKPCDMVSNEEKGSVEDVLRKQLKNNALLAAHRLDKQTSGVMLFVKSREVLERYKHIWKERQIKKIYYAVAQGTAAFDTRTIDSKIDGRDAITHLTKICSANDLTLFQVEIETGRKHQIRVHLAEEALPVVGDTEYGPSVVRRKDLKKALRQMLHAAEITFPYKNDMVTVKAPMPDDFLEFAKMAGFGE